MRWLFVAVVGAGLGVAAEVSSSQVMSHPSWAVLALSIATGCVSVWAGAGVLAGAVLAKRPWAVLSGPLVLLMGVLGYYAAGTVHQGEVDLLLTQLGPHTTYWLVAAAFLGPTLALAGGLTRTASPGGLAVRLAIPIAFVIEISLRHPLSDTGFRIDPTLAWTSVSLIALGCLTALFLAVAQPATSHSQ